MNEAKAFPMNDFSNEIKKHLSHKIDSDLSSSIRGSLRLSDIF